MYAQLSRVTIGQLASKVNLMYVRDESSGDTVQMCRLAQVCIGHLCTVVYRINMNKISY